MKNTTLTITILLISLMSAFSQNKINYKVDGNISGLQDGKVYLLKNMIYKVDTLGITDLKDGNFSFSGQLDQPIKAVIVFKGLRYHPYIILENATTKININSKKAQSKIIGGTIQGIMNKADKIDNDLKTKRAVLMQQFQIAQYNGDALKAKATVDKCNLLTKKSFDKKLDLVVKNKTNLAAAIILEGITKDVDLEKLQKHYNFLSDNVKKSIYGVICKQRIQIKENIQVGKIAPNIVCKDMKNEDMNLHNIKGKIKIIDFWASWCRPCRMEGYHMKKLYEKYKDNGLEIISVSLDKSKMQWVKAVETDQLKWIHVNFNKGFGSEVAKTYCVESIPNIYLLDENNKIIATQLRGEELRKFISKRLEK